MESTKRRVTLAPFDWDDKHEYPNTPNPTQQRVREWVQEKCALYRQKLLKSIPVLYLQGGNGSGKTRGIMAAEMELQLDIPGLRTLWGRNDFKDLKLSVMD
ncbi:MAG TPA: hypothetical protein VKR58_09085, partial [Aquella sp.]|nr:hypothetical protein [Aquella sp.]